MHVYIFWHKNSKNWHSNFIFGTGNLQWCLVVPTKLQVQEHFGCLNIWDIRCVVGATVYMYQWHLPEICASRIAIHKNYSKSLPWGQTYFQGRKMVLKAKEKRLFCGLQAARFKDISILIFCLTGICQDNESFFHKVKSISIQSVFALKYYTRWSWSSEKN